MDGTRDYQTKSKKKKERQISYGITYIWNLKYDTSKAICEILPMKQKQIHRHREQTHSCWGAGGRRDWKFGVQNSKNKPLLSLFLISHFSLRAKLLYLSPGLDFSNHNFALVCPYGALCFQRMLRLMAERGRRNGGTGSL